MPCVLRLTAVLLLLPIARGAFADRTLAHPEMLVSTEWLAQHIKDPQLVILHFSEHASDYKAGHIPGARVITGEHLFVNNDGLDSELPRVEELLKLFEDLGVSNDSRIVIYTTAWPPLASRVYLTLDYLGLGDRAALLDGGLEQWRAENRAISKDDSVTPKRGKITTKPRPEILATFDDVKNASAQGAVLIDSRPDRRYTSGHIPGAVHVYWQENVASDDKNKFLDPNQIRKNYEIAGATSDKNLITYCEIGWQASHAYFTAKYLGYKVKMYDGSYQEWNELKKQPVMTGNKPN